MVDTNYKVWVDLRIIWLHFQPLEADNQDEKHDANQLDGKQRHTGFDYYEYNLPKFGIPGWAQSSLDWNSVDLQKYLEDLVHDQARHQGIHGHGQSETC